MQDKYATPVESNAWIHTYTIPADRHLAIRHLAIRHTGEGDVPPGRDKSRTGDDGSREDWSDSTVSPHALCANCEVNRFGTSSSQGELRRSQRPRQSRVEPCRGLLPAGPRRIEIVI
jgi:hypothetical protein